MISVKYNVCGLFGSSIAIHCTQEALWLDQYFRSLLTANCQAHPQNGSELSGSSYSRQICNNFCQPHVFFWNPIDYLCTVYRNVGKLHMLYSSSNENLHRSPSPDSRLPIAHKDHSHAASHTFKCSSGTCTATQSVWLLHCVLHCRTDPIGSSNVRPTQSLQNGNKKIFQVSAWKGGNESTNIENTIPVQWHTHTTGNYIEILQVLTHEL